MSKLTEKAKKAIFLTNTFKVWLLLFVVGAIIILIGLAFGFLPYLLKGLNFLYSKAVNLFTLNASLRAIIAGIIFILGVLLCVFVVYKIYKFFAKHNDFMFEKLYSEIELSKGPKIVTIGGGTGQYTLLNGLREHTLNISAVVTTMDSGTSSGELKTEFGVLPPGDLRNCIIALSPMDNKVRTMFSKRFDKNSSLKGHPIGNLLIAKLAQDLGSKEAIKQFSELLHIRGKVLPVTFDSAELVAKTQDNKMIIGEDNIGKNALNIKEIGLSTSVKANTDVLDALKEADIIVLGPGDLFTSVLPNLLVPGIKEAITKSPAKKVYVCNLTTKYPETHCFKAENFVSWIEKYVSVDFVLLNTTKPEKAQLDMLLKERKMFVEPVSYEARKFIKADLINEKNPARHDSKKLAEEILNISK